MKRLILDIETAPNKVYAWGLFKQDISIDNVEEPGYPLCFSAKWYGKKGVVFDSLQFSTMDEMIRHAWELLDEADAVIHYNGEKFDIPTLNGEFAKFGYGPPSPFHNIDLYRVVRKNFRLPSNKLDFVLNYFGLPGKHHHKGMSLWHGCMAGNNTDWRQMEKYNKQDVVALEPLYELLLPWIQNHPNMGLYIDDNDMHCTNCGSTHLHKKGVETTKTQIYQRYSCQECGTPLRGRVSLVPKNRRKSIIIQSKR